MEALAKVIYEASDEYDESGVEWEHQYGSAKREANSQARAVAAHLAEAEQPAAAPEPHPTHDEPQEGA